MEQHVMNRVYLYPGEVFASKEPYLVDTILGSCVAVTLWDTVFKFGSINHFMLPSWNGEGEPSPKYGDVAIPRLIQMMQEMGSLRSNLEAKIFGGSSTRSAKGVYNIGSRNIRLAREILKDEQIPVISHSTGGISGRKVVFNSATGEVMLRYIKSAPGSTPESKG
jgi:chemotaxis protein CheD